MRINSNEKELERILTKNNGDGSIHSLNKDKLTKELDLEYYKNSFFSCMYHAILIIIIFLFNQSIHNVAMDRLT